MPSSSSPLMRSAGMPNLLNALMRGDCNGMEVLASYLLRSQRFQFT